ncbi:carboxymuconolactone decarboxylase family protein [Zavarzinia sp. CC-PAN008]|uniref:carboxymuconolactone decarboxylase family protein n=1 Tax=Zavarzinia sp. CC-PAN008 TaxID=3243332 RepID=UPI003F7426B9
MMVALGLEGQIRRAERQLGVPLDYMRTIARHSMRAFLWLGILGSTQPRPRHAPGDLVHMAALGAAMVEDCGTCVQIHVNQALRDGLRAVDLGHAVAGRLEALAPAQALAFRFGQAVAANTVEQHDLREALLAELGEGALVDLALGIAMARLWPTTKRALGHAVACSRVTITGVP